MHSRLSVIVALSAALSALPAHGQDGMMPGDLSSAASKAVESLSSAAKDKVLVKDMLGAEVTGPGGDVIGTVENLVIIPGGRVVAALLATKDEGTGRLAVPFAAVKLSMASETLGVSLPMGLKDLKNNKDVQALTEAVQSGGS